MRRAAALTLCKLRCSKPAIVVFQALYKTCSVLFAFMKSRYLIINYVTMIRLSKVSYPALANSSEIPY